MNSYPPLQLPLANLWLLHSLIVKDEPLIVTKKKCVGECPLQSRTVNYMAHFYRCHCVIAGKVSVTLAMAPIGRCALGTNAFSMPSRTRPQY